MTQIDELIDFIDNITKNQSKNVYFHENWLLFDINHPVLTDFNLYNGIINIFNHDKMNQILVIRCDIINFPYEFLINGRLSI